MKLGGKIALITGGTSGIGLATAHLFASEGATVIITGSSLDSIKAKRLELPGIEVVASDAGDIIATQSLVDTVVQKHGRIDVLHVNAGFGRFAASEGVDEAFFNELFNINVRGAFFLLKHAAPKIPDGGSIILTASMLDRIGGSGEATVYAATKAALRSFGRTFAVELAHRNIRVNTISPGPIDTPALDRLGLAGPQGLAHLDRVKAQVPLGRLGHAEEVAAAALYLAADATFTTASELFVDGGVVGIG